jgi:Zn finger protein HypA/HybF involved in hydrogenase expression
MYLKEETETCLYSRKSKLGQDHTYSRIKRVSVFRCDNCGEIFRRDSAKMSPKRLSNNYFHCCPNCDSKKFAQRKGAERRTIWDKPASSLDDISRL